MADVMTRANGAIFAFFLLATPMAANAQDRPGRGNAAGVPRAPPTIPAKTRSGCAGEHGIRAQPSGVCATILVPMADLQGDRES
jgi:hypothetical protein